MDDMTRKHGPDWHCDDWHAKKLGPPCVAAYLEWARAPAHGLYKDHKPPLYATHPELGRVRIVMASRFGDVGVSRDLNKPTGYERRVLLGDLSDFNDKPPNA